MEPQCEFVLVQQGIEIPSRVFVGRIPFDMTEEELNNVFKAFGRIKDARIVCDRQGLSKGFGFVTFETEEEAQNVLAKGKLRYKSSYINVSKAIRKQGGQFDNPNKEYVNGQKQVSLLHHYSGDYLLNYTQSGLWYAEPLNFHHQPTKPCYSLVPSPVYYPLQGNSLWYPTTAVLSPTVEASVQSATSPYTNNLLYYHLL